MKYSFAIDGGVFTSEDRGMVQGLHGLHGLHSLHGLHGLGCRLPPSYETWAGLSNVFPDVQRCSKRLLSKIIHDLSPIFATCIGVHSISRDLS